MSMFAAGAFKGSTFTLAIVSVAVRAASIAARALKNRREVRRLMEFDDRALKDIGLLRTDVAAALALPLHLDPSAHLIDVAGHKRAANLVGRTHGGPTPSLARLRRPDAAVTGRTAKPLAC